MRSLMLVLLLSPPLWAQQGVVGKVQFTGGTVVQVTNHGYLVMERLYGREFLQRLSRHGTRWTLQQNHRGSRLRQRDRSERAACCDLLFSCVFVFCASCRSFPCHSA